MSLTCATVRLKEEAEELCEIMARMRTSIRLIGGRSCISDEDGGDDLFADGDEEAEGSAIFVRRMRKVNDTDRWKHCSLLVPQISLLF